MQHFPLYLIKEDKEVRDTYILDQFTTFGSKILLLDEIEKYRSKYETDKILLIKDAEGTLHPYWSTAWFREPTEEEVRRFGPFKGNGKFGELTIVSLKWIDGIYKPVVFSLPEGCTKVTGTPNSVYTFEQYLYQFLGFRKLDDVIESEDGVVVDPETDEMLGIAHWIRPNAKFDSYKLGGRYYGIFPLKEGVDTSSDDIKLGEKETNCLFKTVKGVSSALKKDIDFDKMITDSKEKLATLYDTLRPSIEPYVKQRDVMTRSQMLAYMRSEKDVDKIKEIQANFYNQEITQSFLSAVRKMLETDLRGKSISEEYIRSLYDFEDFYITKQDYINKHWHKGIMPMAVIKDGEWHSFKDTDEELLYEEKELGGWFSKVQQLLAESQEDAQISVYDCTY